MYCVVVIISKKLMTHSPPQGVEGKNLIFEFFTQFKSIIANPASNGDGIFPCNQTANKLESVVPVRLKKSADMLDDSICTVP